MTRKLDEDEAERFDYDVPLVTDDADGAPPAAGVGDLGDVNVSTSRSIQAWLAAQIAEARRLRGTWPDFPGGTGRASRKLDGRADEVLPVVLTLAEARAIYAGLLDRAVKTYFGVSREEAEAPGYGKALLPSLLPDVKPANTTDEEWLRSMGVHSKYAMDIARSRKLFEAMSAYTGTTSQGPASKHVAPLTIPYASGDVAVLSPQSAYDFLYWARALAINLDALDGIPDDPEMTWWAIVQAAKEVKETIRKVAKGGINLLLIGAAVVGGALIIGLLRGSGPRYSAPPPPPPPELSE